MNDHPQIDITGTNTLDTCLVPVHDCVTYCFEANDIVETQGSAAAMYITFVAGAVANGLTVNLAGFEFTTASGNSQDTFNWPASATTTAANFAAMLMANQQFFVRFAVQVSGASVLMVGREDGAVTPWTATFPGATPPTVVTVAGVTLATRQDYRLLVEVWKYDLGAPLQLITTQAYEPTVVDGSTGSLCIDISALLRDLVTTRLPDLDAPLAIVADEDIAEQVCIRYGQAYADGECGVSAKFFELASPFTIVNAVTQRRGEGYGVFCYDGVNPLRFMTNRPDGQVACADSHGWLWFNLNGLLYELLATATKVEYLATFYYTDGSIDTVVLDSLTPAVGVFSVAYGPALVLPFADPLLTVDRYEVFISAFVGGLGVQFTEAYNVKVGGCCGAEVYFLAEPGGFDTLHLTELQASGVDVEASTFIGYELCGDGAMQGYGVTATVPRRYSTRFIDDYGSRQWFTEFVKSPVKYLNIDGVATPVVLATSSVALYQQGEYIFAELELVEKPLKNQTV